MYQNDLNIGRNVLRRIEVIEVDDSGPIQRVIVKGFEGEIMKLPLRGQYFGATGNPPPGSVGYALLASGRPEQSFFLGTEHPEHRPKNLPVGCKKIYNAHGDVVSLVEHNIRVKSARIDLNPSGAV